MSKDKLVTSAQIRAIYAFLNKYDMDKDELVLSISKGRTTHCSELTHSEFTAWFIRINDFINNIDDEEKRKAAYLSIWKIAWTMGIIYGNTTDDYEMNKAKLNTFCKERGTVKKDLTKMNLFELKKTHRQFEAMFSKWKQKHYVVQS